MHAGFDEKLSFTNLWFCCIRELRKENDKASPFLCCIPKYGTPHCVVSVTIVSGSGLKKMSRFGVGKTEIKP